MDGLAEEQTKAALYKLFQIRYFEGMNTGKKRLCQLTQEEREDYFRQQRREVEEGLAKVRAALEKIAANLGGKFADNFRNLLTIISNQCDNLPKEYLKNRTFYADLFRAHGFHYEANKLEKLS